MLQALNLLEGFDLAAMGHNSADYIHTVVECMKLAYADREFYYGDPAFADVPMERLLSKEYAAERRRLVDPARASMELRPGGRPAVRWRGRAPAVDARVRRPPRPMRGDTTKLEVIDSAGNMVSATPSGGWLMSSPVVPGLGFPLGTRGQMFSLVRGAPQLPGSRQAAADDADALAGHARRPADDGIRQSRRRRPGPVGLQFLLNVVEFGMSLQQAVEAPTFWTNHFPSSFHPRLAEPGSLYVEGRISQSVRQALEARGHVLHVAGGWEGGNTLAAGVDADTGVRCAAASPRLDPAYAAAM